MKLGSIVWLQETESTQELLKRADFPKGTVIVASRQTKGRGRLGKRWVSSEGGLYFSFLLGYKDISGGDCLPLVIGYGVSDFLEDEGISTAIKWPNDVYHGGRKISGILVEKTGDRLIVGVGINVNQEGFPKDIEAVSMKIVKGRSFNLRMVLLKSLYFIERSLSILEKEGFEYIRRRIEERLLYKGSEIIINSEPPTVGILEGISSEGYLRVLTSEGVKEIAGGEFSLRPYM